MSVSGLPTYQPLVKVKSNPFNAQNWALVRCERCHVVRNSKRIAAYALWKTRRFALVANVTLSVHFVQIEADFNI